MNRARSSGSPSDSSVGGSAACAEAVADAFAQLDARLDSDVAAVRADFAVCAGDDLASAGDRHELLVHSVPATPGFGRHQLA